MDQSKLVHINWLNITDWHEEYNLQILCLHIICAFDESTQNYFHDIKLKSNYLY
jgi:hypothetical protein